MLYSKYLLQKLWSLHAPMYVATLYVCFNRNLDVPNEGNGRWWICLKQKAGELQEIWGSSWMAGKGADV